MQEQMTANIESLLQDHIISAVLYFLLIVAVALVTAGVIKFRLLNDKWKNVLLVSFVVIASVTLLVIKSVDIAPLYCDYRSEAYVVLEDAQVVIKEGASGGLNSTNCVIVYDGEKKIELKMPFDYSIDTEVKYTGKIAYLKNSNYLIWYEFD